MEWAGQDQGWILLELGMDWAGQGFADRGVTWPFAGLAIG
jgi:hypothetical protein